MRAGVFDMFPTQKNIAAAKPTLAAAMVNAVDSVSMPNECVKRANFLSTIAHWTAPMTDRKRRIAVI